MKMLLILLLGFTIESQAADISVVDVRRNITLSESDPVYKDFYISNAPGSGLKKNLVVTAVRKINVRDASGASAVGEITVPVGQLKIIAVYDKVAVAREFTLLSRDELPMLEQIGIMSGDRIDLQGSFIDTSKPKRKVAEVAPEAPATAVVAANPVVSASPLAAAAIVVTPPVAAPAPAPEKLENSAVSSNNTGNE